MSLKYLLDPYLDWARAEGIPIIEDFAVDLLTVDTKPWPRLDTGGAFVHLTGRGDFVSVFLIHMAPGGRSSPQRHLYDEVFYVLSGHGSTTVETADGRTMSFEWGPKSLFAPPLNATYRLFNGSGQEPARLASTNNLCLIMNLFHNEDFIFDNAWGFPEREGRSGHFAGEGELVRLKPGRHMWETNFVPDLSCFELMEWESRGAGSSNIKFILADSVMHAHCSEMPVGTYKKGHRHGPGAHVFPVTGHGYSLLWNEDDEDFIHHEWHHGVVMTPPDQMFHQHFNTSTVAARYLASSMGSHRYPFTNQKKVRKRAPDLSVKDGGLQIDYEDQDRRIHPLFLDELDKNGVKSKMGNIFDETGHSKTA